MADVDAGALPFDALTPDDARKLVGDATSEVAVTNQLFVDGDHWQDGAGWIGPMLEEGHPLFEKSWDALVKGFTSKNVIAEIVERHVGGVVGHEPRWTFALRRPVTAEKPVTDAERVAIAEATSIVREWWGKRGMHQVLQRAVSMALYAGRGPLRLFVPRGRLRDVESGEGTASAATPRSGLSLVFAEATGFESATVAIDDDTQLEAGVRVVQDAKGKVAMDLVYLGEHDPAAEDAPVMTVLRSDVAGEEARAELDLGGRLTMHELRRPLLVTPQVQQNQRALNLALSMVPRNVVTAGFLERVITNASLPYHLEEGPDGEQIEVPDPPKVGAGVTTFIEGKAVEGGQGREGLATPGVHWRPPTPVTPSVEAMRAHYAAILEEADQAHVMIAGDATASGLSREEARGDYEMSLIITAAVVQPAVRWLLETALAFAEAIAGKPGQYTKLLRAEASCRVQSARLSTAERAQVVSEVEKRLRSRAGGMAMLGVVDVEAEIQAMEGEPEATAHLRTAQGQAIRELVDAGAALEGAARLVLSESDAALLALGGGFDETGGDGEGEGGESERTGDGAGDERAGPRPTGGGPTPATGGGREGARGGSPPSPVARAGRALAGAGR